MNIYLVKQREVRGLDTCSEIVVVATDAEQAKLLHPCRHKDLEDWVGLDDDFEPSFWTSKIWVKSPEDVEITLLGKAEPRFYEQAVISYCFHAG